MGQGSLDKQVVVVVGASSGIGRATAVQAATQGARVVVVGRQEEALERLVADLGSLPLAGGPPEAQAVAVDVREPSYGKKVMSRTLERFGQVDAVVYAAGWNVKRRAIGELSLEDWETMIGTNLSGAFYLTQAATDVMRQQGKGLLLYISSSGAKRSDQSGAGYQASKAGLAALAHATMEECRADGIRTTVVYPGLTNTPFVRHRPVRPDAAALENALSAEDVAAACVFVMTLPPRAHVPELLIYPARS